MINIIRSISYAIVGVLIRAKVFTIIEKESTLLVMYTYHNGYKYTHTRTPPDQIVAMFGRFDSFIDDETHV